ncbi:hypothetical protein IP81_19100 [Novosphingobium sp. AAP83]|uniref:TraB/GumN family protein n=1 Tax=Novosphingobium sp. AAP83 TaxID=1523425 RepID=UPI0006B93549|nr:TraB/GumN family protein [Novosphingobium sp. AAP83]KPF87144.1 hypothetical protein IP81_19100 [Novosphingobium sp. AAP83]
MTIRRTLAVAFALAVAAFSGIAHAQEPAAAPAPVRQMKPALWKVADEDTTIYLFGTIHVLPKNLVWFEGPVAKALDASDELVTEIPDVSEAEQQKVVDAVGMLPGGTLRSLMGKTDRAAYEALLKRLKIPHDAFDQYEPWLAGITLGIMPYAIAGYAEEDGAESILRKAALAKGKKEGALETIGFQLGLFDGLSREAQLRFLNEAVRDFDKSIPSIDAMVKHWGAGEPEALANLLNSEMDDPALAEALLFQRNRDWAVWIAARMRQPGRIFIAVGAGHLAGERSVQHVLKIKGIIAERVQ